jgi:hypothetical protein
MFSWNTWKSLILCGCLALCGLVSGCDHVVLTGLNQLQLTEFSVRGSRLFMSGTITRKTLDHFDETFARHPGIETLVPLEVRGSIDDETMLALAYRVRELGLDTHLTAQSEIYSGGVDLFLAGVKRSMETGAVIGVHSWRDMNKDAADYPRDAPEHEPNRKYIEDMLGHDGFYWFTIYAAPAEDIHIMTSEEIARYGLINAG